jgi:Predicted kinase related to galactokinase and mevalonate kinase
VIITQTPLRVGLVGGGTDLPSYYRQHGGRVLNAAIDKYVYVVVKQRFDDDIYLNYSRKEIVSQVEDVEHDLVREAMHMAGVRGGVEITTLADIPSAGSGLGSSSSVTVGLLQALFTYQGCQLSAHELAERACTIEIDRCGKPIGKQDQYVAAYGGICDLSFGPGDAVHAEQIRLLPAQHRSFQDQLMLFYTGITRTADTILGEQKANIPDRLAQLQQLKDLAAEAVAGVRAGRPEVVGMALGRSWEAKRQLAQGVSNGALDEAVESAMSSGATGAKVTGAGGGGFILVMCPVEHQESVRTALSPMKDLPISVDPYGSRVILNVHRNIWS